MFHPCNTSLVHLIFTVVQANITGNRSLWRATTDQTHCWGIFHYSFWKIWTANFTCLLLYRVPSGQRVTKFVILLLISEGMKQLPKYTTKYILISLIQLSSQNYKLIIQYFQAIQIIHVVLHGINGSISDFFLSTLSYFSNIHTKAIIKKMKWLLKLQQFIIILFLFFF